MQRVVIVFVGILSVVWANPFGLDSVERPAMMRNTWVEEVGFGNEALSEDPEHKDDYEIGTFKAHQNTNIIAKSDKGQPLRDGAMDLTGVFGDDIKECPKHDKLPEDGCAKIIQDSLHLINIMSGIDDVYSIAKLLGQLPECLIDDDLHLITKEPCYQLDKKGRDIISFYNWFTNIRYKDGVNVNDYKIGTLQTYKHFNIIAKSDEDRSLSDGAIDLSDVVGDIDNCVYGEEIPDEGCVVIVQDSLHLINTLNGDNMDGVAEVLKKIPKCHFDERKHLTTKEPCYRYEMDDKGYEIISFFNWFTNIRYKHDDDIYDFKIGTFKAYENSNIIAKSDKGQPLRDGAMDLSGVFGDLDICDYSQDEIPEEGCVLIVQDSLHLINTLNGNTMDGAARLLSQLEECRFDEDKNLLTTEPCFQIDEKGRDIISFFNWFTNVRYKDDDVYDYEETRYDSPDAEVSPQLSGQTTTGGTDLQQLILKGLLKRQSSVANTSKSLLLKKIQSRQQPKESQKKRRRQGQHHGLQENKAGRVNHRPMWMKYVQANA